MATVNWQRADAATNSSTPAIVMQALVNVCKAQGWTVEYADSNAIGTGSASDPRFDTVAYSSGASIGIIVLKMPLNGLSTEWRIRIEVKWGTVSGGYVLLMATGTGQSGGVLTNPGTTISVGGATSSSQINSEYYIAAHKNEFLLALPATFAIQFGRFRTLSGVSLDDIQIMATGMSTTFVSGFPAPANGLNPLAGICMTRNVSQGEYPASRALVWGHSASSGNYTAVTTLTDFGGNYGYPLGPFSMGNGPGGFTRLMAYFPTGDIPAALQNFTVTVDGADRLFFVPTGVGALGLSGARWAFAKE